MLQLLRMIPSNHYFLTAENGGKYNNTKQIIPFNTILATKKIRNHYNYCGAKNTLFLNKYTS